jgi:hypothetical protein
MMYWIYDYPGWVIGLLFCGVLVAFTWAGIFLNPRDGSFLASSRRARE